MKVILLDDVTKVGRRGEVRDVSDGYARNFLIPKRLALSATAGNLKNLEHIKKQQEAKADRVKSRRRGLRARIEALAYEERRRGLRGRQAVRLGHRAGHRGFPRHARHQHGPQAHHARGAHQDARRLLGLHASAPGRHRTAQGHRRPRIAGAPLARLEPRRSTSSGLACSIHPSSTADRAIPTGCPRNHPQDGARV